MREMDSYEQARNNTNNRRRSLSDSWSNSTFLHKLKTTQQTGLPTIEKQRIKRKPVVPSNEGRKKYEAILGVKAEDLEMPETTTSTISKKKSNVGGNNNNNSSNSGSSRFRFFGKRSKSVEKKPIVKEIPLAPPPLDRDMMVDEKFELPTDIVLKYEKPERPERPSFQRQQQQESHNHNQYHYQQQQQHHNQNQYQYQYQLQRQQQQFHQTYTPKSPQSQYEQHHYQPQSQQQHYQSQTQHYQNHQQQHHSQIQQQHQQVQQQQQQAQQQQSSNRKSYASTRISSGSYSIYSTFGGSDSIYEQEMTQTDESSVDLVSIVPNNVQIGTSPTKIALSANGEKDEGCNNSDVVEKNKEEEDEEEDDSDDDDDDDTQDDDIFVDAIDISLDDIEKERTAHRLSKRLSGGHFGSAGGLMMSIMEAEKNKNQRRRSRPPPEDVAQSMLNWKRHSGQQIYKSFSDFSIKLNDPLPPVVPDKEEQSIQTKLLPPQPEILFTNDDDDDTNNSGKDKKGDENKEDDDSKNPKVCASKLWQEDESFVQRDRIAEWLGQSKLLNAETLGHYMNYFEFASMRLDGAFRKLCSKLYFRAEAQQIDRILEAFAKRYWQCNPKTIFGNADIVYAVVYSLLLLNTDLHVAQGNYTRMTRQAFVRNTMSTIHDQKPSEKIKNFSPTWEANVESLLKDMYMSVKHNQILQPLSHTTNQPDHPNTSSLGVPDTGSKRLSIMGSRRMTDIKRGLNTMINKTARDSILFLEDPIPRASTSSTHQTQPQQPQQQPQQQSQQQQQQANQPHQVLRRDSSSSTNSGHSSSLSPPTPKSSYSSSLLSANNNGPMMMQFMDSHAAALFASRPPYHKEGVVMRKHLLDSANQKAKHREWKECLLVVGQGELKMYGLQSDSYNDSSSAKRNLIRASTAGFANITETFTKGNSYQGPFSFGGASQNNQGWAKYSHLIGSIKLNHTLSNALPPPGYNRSRPFVFAIQEANGGVHLFQAGTLEQINEWVSTCNYWAARQSKEPLQGGVGNLEYGWGSCLDDVILDLDAVEKGKEITGKFIHDPDSVNLYSWAPPAPTMVSTFLNEKDHFKALQKYVESLNQEINDHREIKKKMIVKFPYKCQNHQRAMTNWEAKSKYMLHEIIKYQNYCNALEDSITRQQEEASISSTEADGISEGLQSTTISRA